jgi:hypothetical protein
VSLATLFKLPETPSDIEEFLFSNVTDHNDIAAAIMRKYNVAIVAYPIYPVTAANMSNMLLAHQAMHTQEADILVVDNQDFLSPDFSEWWYDHADQHRRERQALGM